MEATVVTSYSSRVEKHYEISSVAKATSDSGTTANKVCEIEQVYQANSQHSSKYSSSTNLKSTAHASSTHDTRVHKSVAISSYPTASSDVYVRVLINKPMGIVSEIMTSSETQLKRQRNSLVSFTGKSSSFSSSKRLVGTGKIAYNLVSKTESSFGKHTKARSMLETDSVIDVNTQRISVFESLSKSNVESFNQVLKSLTSNQDVSVVTEYKSKIQKDIVLKAPYITSSSLTSYIEKGYEPGTILLGVVHKDIILRGTIRNEIVLRAILRR